LLLLTGRVCARDRDSYRVATEHAVVRAALGGRLRHTAADGEQPVVGDYVVLETAEYSAVIRGVVSRRNLFVRRGAGGSYASQPIAANLDTLFVTVAANRDFNVRRIERYVAAARSCGIEPAVIVAKADLVDDIAPFLDAARGVAPLGPFLGPGRTVAFVGSSGVGKSTIVNALLGEARLATGAARSSDDRGRHTTTRRELIVAPDGTALIDTPGMREFALADASEGVDAAFADVAELATGCRFRDCSHGPEPGCAVREALDEERLESWRKLRREAEFEASKSDPVVARARSDRWKAIHRANRVRQRLEE